MDNQFQNIDSNGFCFEGKNQVSDFKQNKYFLNAVYKGLMHNRSMLPLDRLKKKKNRSMFGDREG